MAKARPAPNPKVLIVARSLGIGGTERHISQVAPGLARRGFDVTVYCLEKSGAHLTDVRASPCRLRGAAPGKLGAPTLLNGSLGLIPEMLTSRPDIAHFFLPHATIAGGLAAALTQVPVRIASRRCLDDYQAKRPMLAQLERNVLGGMSAVLGNSRAVTNQLARVAEPWRIGLIHNGIDPAAYATPADRRATRASLGIPADAFVIAKVANLFAYKGHADLLAGLAMARHRLPRAWTLLAIGRDEGTLAALKAQAEALGIAGHIHWLGARRDVPDLLAASDLGVLASHEEGFSNAILEGMAAGLPMAVTDAGGNAEAVEHGITGYVVPPRDPGGLGDAIAAIASNRGLARSMGLKGRQRVAREFSLESVLDKYEELYRTLLAGDGVPASLRPAPVAHRPSASLMERLKSLPQTA